MYTIEFIMIKAFHISMLQFLSQVFKSSQLYSGELHLW